MQADAGSPVLPDLLTVLREATGPSHERLDASFGSVDMATRAGLARFLTAHAIGLAPVFPVFRSFLENVLKLECPDYPEMLRADLAGLGVDAEALPRLEAPGAIGAAGAGAGVGYVVCGSRLGLVVIRQQGYWGETQGFRSSYMSDGRGHEAWKALVPVLRNRDHAPSAPPGAAAAVRAAAIATFDLFSQGFAASDRVKPRNDG